jgi:repressor LexA
MDMDNSLGRRLRLLRKGSGDTQNDIAKLLGVTREAVSQWERGENTPTIETLKVLAQRYQVSLDYIVEGKGKPCQSVEIPVVGTIRKLPILSAENIIDKVEVPTNMVKDGNYFQLIVHEDSMTGIGIDKGRRVIVREQEELEDGQVGLIEVGGCIMIRKVYRTNSGYVLVPSNPNYADQKVSSSEIKVLGRVKFAIIEY